eukprot:1186864-Prorocentrum_minimum.AAC.4
MADRISGVLTARQPLANVTFTQSHSHTVTQSHSHTVTQSQSRAHLPGEGVSLRLERMQAAAQHARSGGGVLHLREEHNDVRGVLHLREEHSDVLALLLFHLSDVLPLLLLHLQVLPQLPLPRLLLRRARHLPAKRGSGQSQLSNTRHTANRSFAASAPSAASTYVPTTASYDPFVVIVEVVLRIAPTDEEIAAWAKGAGGLESISEPFGWFSKPFCPSKACRTVRRGPVPAACSTPRPSSRGRSSPGNPGAAPLPPEGAGKAGAPRPPARTRACASAPPADLRVRKGLGGKTETPPDQQAAKPSRTLPFHGSRRSRWLPRELVAAGVAIRVSCRRSRLPQELAASEESCHRSRLL